MFEPNACRGADPLGIPAVFLYFLARQRSRINPPIGTHLTALRDEQYIVVRREVTQDTGQTRETLSRQDFVKICMFVAED